MKPVVKTSLIALSSALIGGALTAGTLKHFDNHEVAKKEVAAPADMFDRFFKEQNTLQSRINSLFDDKFFLRDPFEEMKSMHEEMKQRLGDVNVYNYSYDISEREDSQNVYYDIKVPDVNSTSINTNVENGQLTITGTIEKKNQSDSAQSSFKSSFQRSFPLPDNVDEHKMEMTTENDKIVLRFPKETV